MQKAMCWCKRQASRFNGNENFDFRGSNKHLVRNGSELLEEIISLFHGKTNPIRCFSAAELNAMIIISGSSEQISFRPSDFTWYNGVVDGRKVLIGRINNNKDHCEFRNYIREIAVSTEMSSHNNVHKLLGCCLETKHPVLVFEWLDMNGCLYDRILSKNNQEGRVLKWKDRLRIAWEIAHAVSYLHTAFPRPIIHRNIKPTNVLLDNNIAKLAGFNMSVSIPEGKTYLEADVAGTFGYVAPDYFDTGRVDEKVDVFSFGVLLLMLLRGRNAFHWVSERKSLTDNKQEGAINEIIDPAIANNASSTTKEDLHHQLQASLELALRCTAEKAEHRPTMVEVATRLKSMVDQSL